MLGRLGPSFNGNLSVLDHIHIPCIDLKGRFMLETWYEFS